VAQSFNESNMSDETAVQEEVEKAEKKVSDPISAKKKSLAGLPVREQAQMHVERMFRAKDELKEIKNALKAYKVTSEKMEELKKARKEFTQQINEEKDRVEAEFQKDKTYNELREKVLDQEEKIAVSKQDLRVILRDEAMKNEFFELQFEVNGIPFKLQSQAKVAIYFNGKEEK
jgi:primase-polymerase (primpol)-like protein